MTPRNRDESPGEHGQNKVPRAIHETLDHGTKARMASVPQNTPVVNAQPKEAHDTKVEPDRLELYLQGPTVFSA